MKVGLSKAKSPDKFDFVLCTYMALMAIMSILSIYSAYGILGKDASIDYIMRQVMWYIVGCIAIGAIMYLGNDSMLRVCENWILVSIRLFSCFIISKNLYGING